MTARACVLWDWNGTLLDDTEASLAAFNAQLEKRGAARVGMDFYRAHFAFPVKPFYALCGVDPDREDWDEIAREYHASYAAEPKALNREAIAALERVKAAGARQCVLSALRQDLLDAALDSFGVRGYFDLAYGSGDLYGGSKLDRARQLVDRLSGFDLVMIGDATHDKEVAAALGIRCVLCAQGGHSADRLRAVAPTGDTLLEAVGLALGAIDRGEDHLGK